MGRRKKSLDTPAKIARDIEQRLRSILRQLDELLHPVCHFTQLPKCPPGVPPYFVHLQPNDKPRQVNGLRIRSLVVSLPYEPIQDQAWELALTIWHLHDSL